MTLILLVGGARSGKSTLALQLAARASDEVVFIATGEPRDAEMHERIENHRRERPGSWTTIEEPLELEAVLADVEANTALIVDCLTLWAANALDAYGPAETERRAAAAATAASSRRGLTIAVSNEVGSGIVPATPLGRSYRDLLGRVNALWAERADDVLLLVAGRALRLLPPGELVGELP